MKSNYVCFNITKDAADSVVNTVFNKLEEALENSNGNVISVKKLYNDIFNQVKINFGLKEGILFEDIKDSNDQNIYYTVSKLVKIALINIPSIANNSQYAHLNILDGKVFDSVELNHINSNLSNTYDYEEVESVLNSNNSYIDFFSGFNTGSLENLNLILDRIEAISKNNNSFDLVSAYEYYSNLREQKLGQKQDEPKDPTADNEFSEILNQAKLEMKNLDKADNVKPLFEQLLNMKHSNDISKELIAAYELLYSDYLNKLKETLDELKKQLDQRESKLDEKSIDEVNKILKDPKSDKLNALEDNLLGVVVKRDAKGLVESISVMNVDENIKDHTISYRLGESIPIEDAQGRHKDPIYNLRLVMEIISKNIIALKKAQTRQNTKKVTELLKHHQIIFHTHGVKNENSFDFNAIKDKRHWIEALYIKFRKAFNRKENKDKRIASKDFVFSASDFKDYVLTNGNKLNGDGEFHIVFDENYNHGSYNDDTAGEVFSKNIYSIEYRENDNKIELGVIRKNANAQESSKISGQDTPSALEVALSIIANGNSISIGKELSIINFKNPGFKALKMAGTTALQRFNALKPLAEKAGVSKKDRESVEMYNLSNMRKILAMKGYGVSNDLYVITVDADNDVESKIAPGSDLSEPYSSIAGSLDKYGISGSTVMFVSTSMGNLEIGRVIRNIIRNSNSRQQFFDLLRGTEDLQMIVLQDKGLTLDHYFNINPFVAAGVDKNALSFETLDNFIETVHIEATNKLEPKTGTNKELGPTQTLALQTFFGAYQTTPTFGNKTINDKGLAFRLHKLFTRHLFYLSNADLTKYRREDGKELTFELFDLRDEAYGLLGFNRIELNEPITDNPVKEAERLKNLAKVHHLRVTVSKFMQMYEMKVFQTSEDSTSSKAEYSDFFKQPFKNDLITYLKLFDVLSKGEYSKKWDAFDNKYHPELRFNSKVVIPKKEEGESSYITVIDKDYSKAVDIENKLMTDIVDVNKPSFIIDFSNLVPQAPKPKDKSDEDVGEMFVKTQDKSSQDVHPDFVHNFVPEEFPDFDFSLNNPERSMGMISKQEAMNIVRDIIGDNSKLIFDPLYWKEQYESGQISEEVYMNIVNNNYLDFEKAFGFYYSGVINLNTSNDLVEKEAAIHESVHAAMALHKPEEKRKILESARNYFGLEGATDKDIEEQIARFYPKIYKSNKLQKTLDKFWKPLGDFIRFIRESYIKMTSSKLDLFYTRLSDGYFASKEFEIDENDDVMLMEVKFNNKGKIVKLYNQLDKDFIDNKGDSFPILNSVKNYIESSIYNNIYKYNDAENPIELKDAIRGLNAFLSDKYKEVLNKIKNDKKLDDNDRMVYIMMKPNEHPEKDQETYTVAEVIVKYLYDGIDLNTEGDERNLDTDENYQNTNKERYSDKSVEVKQGEKLSLHLRNTPLMSWSGNTLTKTTSMIDVSYADSLLKQMFDSLMHSKTAGNKGNITYTDVSKYLLESINSSYGTAKDIYTSLYLKFFYNNEVFEGEIGTLKRMMSEFTYKNDNKFSIMSSFRALSDLTTSKFLNTTVNKDINNEYSKRYSEVVSTLFTYYTSLVKKEVITLEKGRIITTNKDSGRSSTKNYTKSSIITNLYTIENESVKLKPATLLELKRNIFDKIKFVDNDGELSITYKGVTLLDKVKLLSKKEGTLDQGIYAIVKDISKLKQKALNEAGLEFDTILADLAFSLFTVLGITNITLGNLKSALAKNTENQYTFQPGKGKNDVHLELLDLLTRMLMQLSTDMRYDTNDKLSTSNFSVTTGDKTVNVFETNGNAYITSLVQSKNVAKTLDSFFRYDLFPNYIEDVKLAAENSQQSTSGESTNRRRSVSIFYNDFMYLTDLSSYTSISNEEKFVYNAENKKVYLYNQSDVGDIVFGTQQSLISDIIMLNEAIEDGSVDEDINKRGVLSLTELPPNIAWQNTNDFTNNLFKPNNLKWNKTFMKNSIQSKQTEKAKSLIDANMYESMQFMFEMGFMERMSIGNTYIHNGLVAADKSQQYTYELKSKLHHTHNSKNKEAFLQEVKNILYAHTAYYRNVSIPKYLEAIIKHNPDLLQAIYDSKLVGKITDIVDKVVASSPELTRKYSNLLKLQSESPSVSFTIAFEYLKSVDLSNTTISSAEGLIVKEGRSVLDIGRALDKVVDYPADLISDDIDGKYFDFVNKMSIDLAKQIENQIKQQTQLAVDYGYSQIDVRGDSYEALVNKLGLQYNNGITYPDKKVRFAINESGKVNVIEDGIINPVFEAFLTTHYINDFHIFLVRHGVPNAYKGLADAIKRAINVSTDGRRPDTNNPRGLNSDINIMIIPTKKWGYVQRTSAQEIQIEQLMKLQDTSIAKQDLQDGLGWVSMLHSMKYNASIGSEFSVTAPQKVMYSWTQQMRKLMDCVLTNDLIDRYGNENIFKLVKTSLGGDSSPYFIEWVNIREKLSKQDDYKEKLKNHEDWEELYRWSLAHDNDELPANTPNNLRYRFENGKLRELKTIQEAFLIDAMHDITVSKIAPNGISTDENPLITTLPSGGKAFVTNLHSNPEKSDIANITQENYIGTSLGDNFNTVDEIYGILGSISEAGLLELNKELIDSAIKATTLENPGLSQQEIIKLIDGGKGVYDNTIFLQKLTAIMSNMKNVSNTNTFANSGIIDINHPLIKTGVYGAISSYIKGLTTNLRFKGYRASLTSMTDYIKLYDFKGKTYTKEQLIKAGFAVIVKLYKNNLTGETFENPEDITNLSMVNLNHLKYVVPIILDAEGNNTADVPVQRDMAFLTLKDEKGNVVIGEELDTYYNALIKYEQDPYSKAFVDEKVKLGWKIHPAEIIVHKGQLVKFNIPEGYDVTDVTKDTFKDKFVRELNYAQGQKMDSDLFKDLMNEYLESMLDSNILDSLKPTINSMLESLSSFSTDSDDISKEFIIHYKKNNLPSKRVEEIVNTFIGRYHNEVSQRYSMYVDKVLKYLKVEQVDPEGNPIKITDDEKLSYINIYIDTKAVERYNQWDKALTVKLTRIPVTGLNSMQLGRIVSFNGSSANQIIGTSVFLKVTGADCDGDQVTLEYYDSWSKGKDAKLSRELFNKKRALIENPFNLRQLFNTIDYEDHLMKFASKKQTFFFHDPISMVIANQNVRDGKIGIGPTVKTNEVKNNIERMQKKAAFQVIQLSQNLEELKLKIDVIKKNNPKSSELIKLVQEQVGLEARIYSENKYTGFNTTIYFRNRGYNSVNGGAIINGKEVDGYVNTTETKESTIKDIIESYNLKAIDKGIASLKSDIDYDVMTNEEIERTVTDNVELLQLQTLIAERNVIADILERYSTGGLVPGEFMPGYRYIGSSEKYHKESIIQFSKIIDNFSNAAVDNPKVGILGLINYNKYTWSVWSAGFICQLDEHYLTELINNPYTIDAIVKTRNKDNIDNYDKRVTLLQTIEEILTEKDSGWLSQNNVSKKILIEKLYERGLNKLMQSKDSPELIEEYKEVLGKIAIVKAKMVYQNTPENSEKLKTLIDKASELKLEAYKLTEDNFTKEELKLIENPIKDEDAKDETILEQIETYLKSIADGQVKAPDLSKTRKYNKISSKKQEGETDEEYKDRLEATLYVLANLYHLDKIGVEINNSRELLSMLDGSSGNESNNVKRTDAVIKLLGYNSLLKTMSKSEALRYINDTLLTNVSVDDPGYIDAIEMQRIEIDSYTNWKIANPRKLAIDNKFLKQSIKSLIADFNVKEERFIERKNTIDRNIIKPIKNQNWTNKNDERTMKSISTEFDKLLVGKFFKENSNLLNISSLNSTNAISTDLTELSKLNLSIIADRIKFVQKFASMYSKIKNDSNYSALFDNKFVMTRITTSGDNGITTVELVNSSQLTSDQKDEIVKEAATLDSNTTNNKTFGEAKAFKNALYVYSLLTKVMSTGRGSFAEIFDVDRNLAYSNWLSDFNNEITKDISEEQVIDNIKLKELLAEKKKKTLELSRLKNRNYDDYVIDGTTYGKIQKEVKNIEKDYKAAKARLEKRVEQDIVDQSVMIYTGLSSTGLKGEELTKKHTEELLAFKEVNKKEKNKELSKLRSTYDITEQRKRLKEAGETINGSDFNELLKNKEKELKEVNKSIDTLRKKNIDKQLSAFEYKLIKDRIEILQYNPRLAFRFNPRIYQEDKTLYPFRSTYYSKDSKGIKYFPYQGIQFAINGTEIKNGNVVHFSSSFPDMITGATIQAFAATKTFKKLVDNPELYSIISISLFDGDKKEYNTMAYRRDDEGNYIKQFSAAIRNVNAYGTKLYSNLPIYQTFETDLEVIKNSQEYQRYIDNLTNYMRNNAHLTEDTILTSNGLSIKINLDPNRIVLDKYLQDYLIVLNNKKDNTLSKLKDILKHTKDIEISKKLNTYISDMERVGVTTIDEYMKKFFEQREANTDLTNCL